MKWRLLALNFTNRWQDFFILDLDLFFFPSFRCLKLVFKRKCTLIIEYLVVIDTLLSIITHLFRARSLLKCVNWWCLRLVSLLKRSDLVWDRVLILSARKCWQVANWFLGRLLTTFFSFRLLWRWWFRKQLNTFGRSRVFWWVYLMRCWRVRWWVFKNYRF